jgi:uncharacterized membrane protein YeaQ/YmgE (transglycosylase-associated protein family)
MHAFLGNPSVGFFSMVIIGIIAGIIADRVNSENHGIFTNILIGVAGAFVGKELSHLLGINIFGFFQTLIAAAVGASLILFVWRKVHNQA